MLSSSRRLPLVGVATLVVCAWAIPASSAEDGPVIRILSFGTAGLEGQTSRRESAVGAPTTRSIKYAVSRWFAQWPSNAKTSGDLAAFRPITSHWSSPCPYVDMRFSGIELTPESEGSGALGPSAGDAYAYVRIDATRIVLDDIMLNEWVQVVFDDPVPYVPLIVDLINLHVRESPKESPKKPAEIASQFRLVADAAPDGDALIALIDEVESERVRLSRERVGQLIADLFGREPDVRTRAAIGLVQGTMDNDELEMRAWMFRYPFIIARRTIGGANGTEVVVLSRDTTVGAPPRTAEVYYVYLATDSSPPKDITVVGYQLNSGVETTIAKAVPVCSFAKVELVAMLHNGIEQWFVKNLDVQAIGAGLPTHLHNVVKSAFRDACILEHDPTNPQVGCNPLDLTCP